MTSCTHICRSILFEKLSSNADPGIPIPEELVVHRDYVFSLLKSTVQSGENNSALIIGPRGSGKTKVINSVLAELENVPNFNRDAVVIKLHGFFQTDDRIAIQEITRQLFMEKESANKVFGSFAENLNFLLESLKSADRKATKSIIFIMDEFDQFCQHKNQTLLYNLFDVCQSAQAPMAVIGLTCRMDAISLFEKRVRSRFSHRQIYLLSKPDFEKYSKHFETLLSLQTASRGLKAIYVKSWNKSIQGLIEDPLVIGTLRKLFNVNAKPRFLHNILFVAISQLCESHPFLSAKDIVAAYESQTTDCKTLQLQGLSVLELQLLLSMKYLDKIYYGEPCNYEMAFYEYTKQMKTGSMQKFDRLIALKAMEHLETLELIKPADGITSKIQKEFVVYNVLVTSEQLAAALPKFPNLPTEVKQWADSCL